MTYHTASCSNKRIFFFLLSFSLLEISHSDWEARAVNSWKKKMRDYKVIILMRKPVVSRRRNLVWRWDRKKKRAYLFGWSDLQITVWCRFYDNSISWSRKIIDGCLTIVCFFENKGPLLGSNNCCDLSPSAYLKNPRGWLKTASTSRFSGKNQNFN